MANWGKHILKKKYFKHILFRPKIRRLSQFGLGFVFGLKNIFRSCLLITSIDKRLERKIQVWNKISIQAITFKICHLVSNPHVVFSSNAKDHNHFSKHGNRFRLHFLHVELDKQNILSFPPYTTLTKLKLVENVLQYFSSE